MKFSNESILEDNGWQDGTMLLDTYEKTVEGNIFQITIFENEGPDTFRMTVRFNPKVQLTLTENDVLFNLQEVNDSVARLLGYLKKLAA